MGRKLGPALPKTPGAARSGAQPPSGTAGRATPSCQMSSSQSAQTAQLCSETPASSGGHDSTVMPSHLRLGGGGINHGRSSRSSSQTRVVDRYPQVGRSGARARGHARHDFRPLIGYLRLPDCLPTNRSVASRPGPAHRRGPRP